MADRIIKGDSGNDVIIQNNAGSRKIEVTNSGDVEVTGDVKTTTVKSTNLKANDGTASLEIADSTGDIGFSGNTNLKIKLPSAGGIYESDGSTEILTESGGAVSLKNTVIDSTSISNGQLIKSEFFKYTSGSDFDTTSTTITAAEDYQSFSCTVGNTIIFYWNFFAEVFRNTGTETGRRGQVYCYQSTSAVSENATSSLGTALNEFVVGRILESGGGVSATGYIPVFIQGSFVATNTTHYLGLTAKTLTASNVTFRVTRQAAKPLSLSIFEFKGDVLT